MVIADLRAYGGGGVVGYHELGEGVLAGATGGSSLTSDSGKGSFLMRKVSVKIPAGQYVAVIGHPHSGKSTLLGVAGIIS